LAARVFRFGWIESPMNLHSPSLSEVRMKMTLELPDALVKQIKLRAVRRDQKLKDAIAELLRKGLNVAHEQEANEDSPVIRIDRKTGFPVIECKQAAVPEEKLAPERVANILLAQKVSWHDEAGR
jgi:hypothetical protein